MEALSDLTNLKNIKSSELVSFRCQTCSSIFQRQARFVKSSIKYGANDFLFCNNLCRAISRNLHVNTTCGNCGATICVKASERRKSKSGHSFCNRNCSAVYNNTHKTTGCRCSKIELWIQTQLIRLYPELNFQFNDKTIINSELDIYCSSLKLAFEINGIFHYKPVYGLEKFISIQNNDSKKIQTCLEHGINLITIDVSNIEHFKPERASAHLQTIVDHIKLARVRLELTLKSF